MRYVIILTVLALIAVGCIGYESAYPVERAPAAPTDSFYEASGAYMTQESQITIKVQQDTLEIKYSEMETMLESYGAQLTNIDYYETNDRKQYVVTIRVNPAKFNMINEQLRQLGEVKDASVNLEDVTQEYVDLDTRIKNREVELGRLYGLYNESANISDLLAIEKEISRVETELELLKQQKHYLISRIESSTINIYLYEDTPPTEQLTISLEGLGVLFFSALATAISLLVFAAGFLLPIAIVVAVLWMAYNKLKGRGKETKSKPRKPGFSQIPPEQ